MADSQVSIKVTAKDEASATLQKTAEAIRNVNDNYESLSAYMKRTSAEAQNAATAQKQTALATEAAGNAADGATGHFDSLFKTFTVGTLAANAIEKGLQLASQAIRQSLDDATAMQRSIEGLSSAAGAAGVSSTQLNSAISTLTADGMLSFMDTSTALQNLLAKGLGIDNATALIQRFKDEAAFGGSETISFTDKVKNLSEAYLTGSSQLGNLNGHTQNFSDALEIGAGILGKSTAAMSEAEKQQATLIGYMEQGAYTAGNAARMADTQAGANARQAVEAQNASVALGTALAPAAQYATMSFTDFLQSLNDTSGSAQDLQAWLVTVAAIVRTVAQTVVGSAQIIWGALNSIATLSFDPLNKSIDRAGQGFVDTWNDAYKQYEKIYSGAYDTQIKDLQDQLEQMNKAYDGNAVKRSQQEEDLTRQFQRSMEQRAKSFTESLQDMIIAHRDKSLSIKADLAEEDAAYAKSAQKREAAYLDDLASLEERHAEKVADINDQISQEQQKGILDNGQFFSTANQQKLDKLQQSLTEEDRKYQQSIDKRKAQYSEDVADAKAAHDQKLANLQSQLNEELAILNKHRADVAAVGDAQKEDDLSRLKRQFAESNAEAARNYQEQLTKIRGEGAAQGSAYSDAYLTKMNELKERIKQLQDQSGKEQEKQASDAGSKAGSSWVTGFAQAMDSFSKNNAWGKMIQELTKGQEQFVRGVASFFHLDPNAMSRLLTGRASGGVVQPGEITMVGERGPEIAQFPAGTRIIPAQETQQLLRSGASGGNSGLNISIGTQVIQSPFDMEAQWRWLALKVT